MRKEDVFPYPYFDVVNVKIASQGEEFDSTAEQDTYVQIAVQYHDKLVDQVKLLRKLICDASLEGMLSEELFLSQAGSYKLMKDIENEVY